MGCHINILNSFAVNANSLDPHAKSKYPLAEPFVKIFMNFLNLNKYKDKVYSLY